MKKLLLLLVVTLIVVGGYKKVFSQQSPTQPLTKQEQGQFKNYQAEQARIEQLQKLQSPQYVEGKLRNVGKLTTLEGTFKYSDTITEKGLWNYLTLRQITLDLQYQFGLGIDLQYIKVAQVIDQGKTIIMQIPKQRIQLEYLQLCQDSKIIDGKKMLFISQFKPSAVAVVIGQSQQNVVNQISTNRKYFDIAMSNLKGQLENFCKSFGYEKIIFEEV